MGLCRKLANGRKHPNPRYPFREPRDGHTGVLCRLVRVAVARGLVRMGQSVQPADASRFLRQDADDCLLVEESRAYAGTAGRDRGPWLPTILLPVHLEWVFVTPSSIAGLRPYLFAFLLKILS